MTTLKLVPVQPKNKFLLDCQVFAPYRIGQLRAVDPCSPLPSRKTSKREPARNSSDSKPEAPQT